MAQRVVTSFLNTNLPGAYPNVEVKSNPVGLAATGFIAIVGEADGGPSFSSEDIKNNFYSITDFDRVAQKYVAGPIVDAMRALTAPSADANITGGPSRVYIIKTNTGSKAAALVDTNYGTLRAKIEGKGGNQIKYQITESQAEIAPEVSGSTIAAFGAALDGASFSVRLNGGAATVITLSNTPADHQDLATLLVELNTLLPSGVTAEAGDAADSVKFVVDADPANYRKGWGKTLELVDSTPTDLALLGHTAGLTRSAAESEIELSVIRSDIGLNETLAVAGEIALEIGYLGTTATLTITSSTLTTTVTGGSGANLSINLNEYRTIADLAAFISSQTGYKAAATTSAAQAAPSQLDRVSAIGIATDIASASARPGRVKRSLANFSRAASQSSAVEFVAQDVDGLPTPMSLPAFLAGGTKGGTSSAEFVDALAALEAVSVNIVVPLFSRDASEDIAEALTESASAYTIDAVHAATKNHVLKMSTVKLKRNRLAILSFWGAYLDAQAKAQTLANFRQSMTFQKVSQVGAAGVQSFLPWYGAVVAAGMQTAGFYKGITNRFANIISFEDPSGFDSGNPGDLEKALDAGMLILQQDTAGNKWVSDQTTYGFDTNFVYNSLQASYLADIAALDLADSFQKAFVGQSLADVDAATALSFLANKMEGYKRLKIISSSDDAPLGYINPKIVINGPVMEVSVEIKLSTTIYFIPISIQISQISQSAEG